MATEQNVLEGGNQLKGGVQQMPAIYVPPPIGQKIVEGEVVGIVKPVKITANIDRNLYLASGNKIYGIVKLFYPKKISLTDFNRLKPQHGITGKQRTKWWGNRKEFFYYSIRIIDVFNPPRRFSRPRGNQIFIPVVVFLSSDQIEEDLIQNIDRYDPKELDNQTLKDDWRIISAWYSNKKRGTEVKISYEQISRLAKLIIPEMRKRKLVFHPESMKFYPRMLFRKTIAMLKQENAFRDDGTFNPIVLDKLEDFTVVKGFISLIGSAAETERKPNDIDFLIRMTQPSDSLRRAIEVRMRKSVQNLIGLGDKCHFVWGDEVGPHDTFYPLYDLTLMRTHPMTRVEMGEILPLVTVLTPITPLKPRSPANVFFDIGDLKKELFGGVS